MISPEEIGRVAKLCAIILSARFVQSDLFHLARFCSRFWCPGTETVDDFSQFGRGKQFVGSLSVPYSPSFESQ